MSSKSASVHHHVDGNGNCRVLNARRSLPNDHDVFLPRKAFKLSHVDYKDLWDDGMMPGIYDQGDKGSCTAHGWMRAFERVQLLDIARKMDPKNDGFQFDVPAHYEAGSRRYFYRKETEYEGNPGEDDGAQITTGGQVFALYGVPREKVYPYLPDDPNFLAAPPADVEAEAKKHTENRSFMLQDWNHVMESIVDGFPAVVGLSLYSSFMSDQMAATGKGALPKSNESYLGGHCVAITGFDLRDPKNPIALLDNSWNTTWGGKFGKSTRGRFSLPVAYLQNSNLAFDFMTLRPGWSVPRFVKP